MSDYLWEFNILTHGNKKHQIYEEIIFSRIKNTRYNLKKFETNIEV